MIGLLIDKVAVKYPEWRFGQIIANAVRAETGRMDCDPFYIEDEDLRRGLHRLLNQAS